MFPKPSILPNKVGWTLHCEDCFSAFSLRSKCACYTFDFSWPGGWWVLMSGPTAFCQSRQKFRVGRGGSPCPSVGDYLPGCTACTNSKKKREYFRNPTWDAPKVSRGPALWRDSYPAKGAWGRHGVEIRALKETLRFLVNLAKSCTLPPCKKTTKKEHSTVKIWQLMTILSQTSYHCIMPRNLIGAIEIELCKNMGAYSQFVNVQHFVSFFKKNLVHQSEWVWWY